MDIRYNGSHARGHVSQIIGYSDLFEAFELGASRFGEVACCQSMDAECAEGNCEMKMLVVFTVAGKKYDHKRLQNNCSLVNKTIDAVLEELERQSREDACQ